MIDVDEACRLRAEAVHIIISNVPELHNQESWTTETACGTKRCVAGWTLFNEGYSDLTIRIWGSYEHQLLMSHTAAKAAELLGINRRDAYILFYQTDNAEAVAAMEWLAAGKQLQWREILGDDRFKVVDLQAAFHFMEHPPF